MQSLSQKQNEICYGKLRQYNIAVGVTGSGKSFAMNIRFYGEVCSMPANSNIMLTGNTNDSLYKNVITELLAIDGDYHWLEYTRSPARIKTKNGCEIFCIGVNNEGADNRIQGGSVALWYADEPTTYPKSAFNMCLSRCRGKNAAGELELKPVMMTMNPDDDQHYIKKELIDKRELHDCNYWEFGFQDNPTIGEDYIAKIKSQYVGAFYERMILGRWTGGGELSIIPEFSESCVVDEPLPEYYNGIGALDPGFNDFSAYIVGVWDFKKARLLIVNEWGGRGCITPEIAAGIKQADGSVIVSRRVSDTEPRLIAELKQAGIEIRATQKDDLQAQVNSLRIAFKAGKVLIHPRCKRVIAHVRGARWKKNLTEFDRTDDEGHFDFLAALIYLWRNVDKITNPYPVYYGFEDGKIYGNMPKVPTGAEDFAGTLDWG